MNRLPRPPRRRPPSWLRRPASLILLTLGACLAAGPTLAAGAGVPLDRLKVALVSGSVDRYDTDRRLEKLKRNLEAFYPFDCTLILPNPNDEGFDRIEALRDVDVALFYVRRRTPPPQALAEIRRFMDSGKGAVVVGPSSHAWENWPDFDVEVLGAKYEGPPAERKGTTKVRLRAHPIFTGGEDFSTSQYVFRYSQLAGDVQVLMEAEVEGKFTPIAWTRERKGTRIFYLAPANREDFESLSYFRIVANSLFWAARREIPGVGTQIRRTWMPDSHPSSIAVGFPAGLNFCFDPTRGALAYAWEGDYVDRWPTVAGKFPRDAVVQGQVFYKASPESGFRPERAAPPAIHFRGYQVTDNRPEFMYDVNGLAITERVSPKSDGSGLVRHFRVETAGEAFRFRPDDPRQVTLHQGPAAWMEGQLHLPARSVIEFSITTPRHQP